jgi:transposase-like protein
MQLAKRIFRREFKIQVCEEIELKIKTQAQVCREHSLSANLISRWISEYRQDPTGCFAGTSKYPVDAQATRIKELEAALGRATYELQVAKEANVLLKKVSLERRFTK